MQNIVRLLISVMVWMFIINVLPANCQEKQKKEVGIGTLVDGKTITKEDLFRIFKKHKKWLDTFGKEGQQADLEGAKLTGTDLSEANLSKVKLEGADLDSADLHGANLIGANLSGAHLIEANLSWAILREAILHEADLHGADLREADLRGTDLSVANLSKANLSWAYLDSTTKLHDTNLHESLLYNVDLSVVIYQPKQGYPPYIPSVANYDKLDSLFFEKLSHGLIDLREGFKKAGLRMQERQITYAIRHRERLNLWEEDNIFSKIESLFHLIMFEITCQYGMSSGRSLLLLAVLILTFSISYMIALRIGGRKTGIWVMRLPDRVLKGLVKEKPFKLTTRPPFRSFPDGKFGEIRREISRWFRVFRIGLYFSTFSAFSIGWRELNVSNWIIRMQRREYILRATGWVRFVSGLQSLISVYLLALWVLSYFGRPFE